MTIVIIAVVLLALWYILTSNGFNKAKVKIDESLSDIDVALQKRYDVLTKMIDVCKSYAKHEKDTIFETIKLRKGMSVGEIAEASKAMDDSFSKINVLAEAYPELKSSENYKELQKGIADVEEHLQAARRAYNANVSSFNQKLVVFPSSLVAKAMKLEKAPFFEAGEGKTEDVKMDL